MVIPATMCLRNTSKTVAIASDFFIERREVLCEISEMAVLADMGARIYFACLFFGDFASEIQVFIDFSPPGSNDNT